MLEEIKTKLESYHQEHLLKYYDELNEEEKKHLLKQIYSIDFDFVDELYSRVNKPKEQAEISSMVSYESNEEYEQIGIESIKRGEYAVITMAGGQGTRLGFRGPKGCYMLEYGINKSLFEIQCDKLKDIYEKHNIYVDWFIMTSYENNDETVNFFVEKNYFNYPKDKINFFIQEELPLLDINGKILMNAKYNIKMGSNGHGGVFSALTVYGLLDKMKQKNIKWLFFGGIDNILLPINKLDLVGFAIKGNYLITSKIVLKAYPEEKVGVFCKKNGRPSVMEYFEMTPEMNNLRDDKGELVYKDVHTISNIFNISILDKIANKNLAFLAAFKKVEYMDELGNLITPEKGNAYKFECFIFDAFSYVDEVGLLRGKREDIFAPIKNATGVDSPETASKLYIDFMNKK